MSGCGPTPPWSADWRDTIRHLIAEMIRETESPVEALLAVALWIEGDDDGGFFFSPERPFRLFAQREVDGGARRIDFAVIAGKQKIAVEVDGYHHHDSTPEQATATKARSRELTSLGWEPLPFSASEVSKNPRAAAREVRRRIEQKRGVPMADGPAFMVPPLDQPLKLTASQEARAGRSEAENLGLSLLEIVLCTPAMLFVAPVRRALLSVTGPIALAATVLVKATDERATVDWDAFLASCPALVQPLAVECMRRGVVDLAALPRALDLVDQIATYQPPSEPKRTVPVHIGARMLLDSMRVSAATDEPIVPRRRRRDA